MTPDTSCSAPPIAPARKACPRRSMLGASVCGTDKAMNGVRPTAISTAHLGGTKASDENTISEKTEPMPKPSTTPQLM